MGRNLDRLVLSRVFCFDNGSTNREQLALILRQNHIELRKRYVKRAQLQMSPGVVQPTAELCFRGCQFAAILVTGKQSSSLDPLSILGSLGTRKITAQELVSAFAFVHFQPLQFR